MPKLVNASNVAVSEPNQFSGTSLPILMLVGIPTPRGAPPGQTASPIYVIGATGQVRHLMLVGGDLQSKIIPGQNGLSIRDNTDSFDNLLVGGTGNTTGGVTVPRATAGNGLSLNGGIGGASSTNTVVGTYTGITNNSATGTTVITVPNVSAGAMVRLDVLASIGAGDSAGPFEINNAASYNIAITRVAGQVAAAVISSAYGTATAPSGTNQATSLSLTVAVAQSGGATATNTITVNVTIARGAGASSNHQAIIAATLVNSTVGGITITA